MIGGKKCKASVWKPKYPLQSAPVWRFRIEVFGIGRGTFLIEGDFYIKMKDAVEEGNEIISKLGLVLENTWQKV